MRMSGPGAKIRQLGKKKKKKKKSLA